MIIIIIHPDPSWVRPFGLRGLQKFPNLLSTRSVKVYQIGALALKPFDHHTIRKFFRSHRTSCLRAFSRSHGTVDTRRHTLWFYPPSTLPPDTEKNHVGDKQLVREGIVRSKSFTLLKKVGQESALFQPKHLDHVISFRSDDRKLSKPLSFGLYCTWQIHPGPRTIKFKHVAVSRMLSDTFSRLTGISSTSGAELSWPMQIDSASWIIDTKIRLV